jgi:Na+/phosphate symporter
MRNTKTHPVLVFPVLVFCWLLCGVLLAVGVVLIMMYKELDVRTLGAVLIGLSAVVMCCAAVASVQVYRQFCIEHKDLAPLYKDEFTTNYE